ncbi:MAG: VCBS repeat-containing protein [Acidobacteria bacterium]|nr:VCBS repeat-containing protein [Acidobacteriota bacterium]
MRLRMLLVATAVVMGFGAVGVHGAGPTFRADYRFTGSTLSGFTPVGAATWRVQNGEIVGTPKEPSGGWLLLDAREFQNLQLYANVQCTASCKAGLLVRAERTADGGLKGILMSLTEGDVAPYLVKIDANGKEVSREAVQAPAGRAGRAGQGAAQAGGRAGGAAPAPAGGGAAATLVMPSTPSPELAARLPKTLLRPTATFTPGSYNESEILITNNTLSARINGAGSGGNRPLPDAAKDGFGQIALYVGGTGEARFKDLAAKDILKHKWTPEEIGTNYRAIHVDPHFYSWSTAIADFNRDGNMDVAAGAFYYLGPDFTVGGEIYPQVTFNQTTEYPLAAMVNVADDFTGDGWPDVLQMSGAAGNSVGTLFVNPKGQSRSWPKYVTLPQLGNEETIFKDITGDNQPELIHSGANSLLQFSSFDVKKWDPANPTALWTTTTLSEPGPWGANLGHGMGVADINGDGRADYLNPYGWWEQPAASGTAWIHHLTAFARWGATAAGAGGAQLCGYDINGDGLTDVVGPQEGHGFGISWFEQKRQGTTISFVEHKVMDGFLSDNAGGVMFTEPHASACADIDGDGITDLVTGKRYMAHPGYTDPDPWGEPVTYVYRTVRNKQAPGGAEFVPELVHNRSGVGSHLAVGDMNKDGMMDIITSDNFGTFVFLNTRKKPR